MSELKYESLIPQEYSKVKTSFDNQTVLFFLNGTNTPLIGYSGEFLFKRYRQTWNSTDYTKTSEKDKGTQETTNNANIYRYYERVKDMIFKYGMSKELYKNSHGTWVDITAIRKNIKTFLNLITGVIDESFETGEFKTSVYVKIADYIFNHLEENSVLNQYIVDPKDIPRATFIDSNGQYFEIGPGDGTIEVSEPKSYQFARYLESENIDNIHVKDEKYILFDQVLSNSETGLVASKSYENNDVHKFDDLKLTFLHADKTTPFTDLDNLLIFVNGMIVDYKRHPTIENAIYLPNVKRLANIQQVGLKSGYGPDSHLTYQKNEDKKSAYYEFDNTYCKFSYKFDIRIYKWDNVKLSHFVLPINQKTVLKSESYSMNTYWLPIELLFSDKINKDKTILICSGEIIPKTEWDIDPNNEHGIRLLYNEFEFNQLMNEMTKKMKEYLVQVVEHDTENEPKLSDFITNYSSQESITKGFNDYVAAMNEYITDISGGFYDNHFALSAINTVVKEFDNRTYSIITVDTIEDSSYNVKFYENYEDIIIDKPVINQLTNKNWSPDDIVIINGISQNLVNVYEDKFKLPTTNWLPYQDNIFNHCNAYKFQIVKEAK